MVDKPKAWVLSQHLCVQPWLELQRITSADMNREAVVRPRIGLWAKHNFLQCQYITIYMEGPTLI